MFRFSVLVSKELDYTFAEGRSVKCYVLKLHYRRRSTRCVLSKFVLFHKVWELVRFQTAKVTFKVIQGNGITNGLGTAGLDYKTGNNF